MGNNNKLTTTYRKGRKFCDGLVAGNSESLEWAGVVGRNSGSQEWTGLVGENSGSLG